jgi:hypothetical protein
MHNTYDEMILQLLAVSQPSAMAALITTKANDHVATITTPFDNPIDLSFWTLRGHPGYSISVGCPHPPSTISC